MLTNDKSSHVHWVITIEIMKFFETDFEVFSCNLLIKKRRRQLRKYCEVLKRDTNNWNKFVKDRQLGMTN